MKKPLVIIITLLLAFVTVPNVYASPVLESGVPADAQYGQCDGNKYYYYEDWTVGSSWEPHVWGAWVEGSGFHGTADPGYPVVLQFWNATTPVDALDKDLIWVMTDLPGKDWVFNWFAQYIGVTDGYGRMGPDLAGQNTWGWPEIQLSSYDTDDYLTAIYASGPYTGDCPVDDLDPIPAGVIPAPYKPLHDEVTYEVNHIDGYGPMVDDVHTDEGVNAYNSFAGQVVAIESGGTGYLIKVLADDDSYTIYDNLATVYPKLNDTIEAGCIIGTVGESFKAPTNGPYSQDPGLLWYYSGTDFYDFDTNEYIDWQNEFVEPSATASPCGSELRTDNCIDYNPALDDYARGWTPLYIDDFDIGQSQVKLSSHSASLNQYMVLDDTADYYVTLKTKQYSASYDYISVVLTTATDLTIIDTLNVVTQTDNPGDPLISEVGPLTFTQSDVNNMYIVSVFASNSYTNGVWIDDVCVHTGSAVIGHEYCYFEDYDLDDSAEWDSDAGADWSSNPDTFEKGVVLGPGEWLSAPISLSSYESTDADYYLTIGAKVTGIDIGDISELFGPGWEVDVGQEVMDGEVVELDIGDITVSNVLVILSQETEFTVPVSTTLIGDLTITSDVLNTKNVFVDYVCIHPVTGVWPGDEPDIDPGTDDPADVCLGCAMPNGLSIPEWFTFLWCNLARFFTCDLMAWIAAITSWLRQLKDILGYLGRLLGVLMGQLAAWLMALLAVFGIALKNAILYVLGLAWNLLAGLDFIRFLYDLIGYAIAVLTGLTNAVFGAFGLIISFFNILLGIGHLIEQFVAGLMFALSSDVATITLPSCDPPATPLISGFCVPLAIGEGIFEEFPALSTSMILHAGLFGLVTIVWTIRQMGEAVGNVA